MDPLVVEQHKDNQVLFILACSLFYIEEIAGWNERAERTERTVPELITCLTPSHPPDHEVLNFFFNYQVHVNKMSCALEMAAAPVNEIID